MPDILEAQNRLDVAVEGLDCLLDLLCGHMDVVQISADGLHVLLRYIAEDARAARKLLES